MKLIVVDIQKGITDERLYDFEGFIKNVTNIIDAAKKITLRLFMCSMMMDRGQVFLSAIEILRLQIKWRQKKMRKYTLRP